MAAAKRVLIITYYWPPTGASGVQRWLKFAKYLPENGWKPVIYTPENPERPAIDHSLESDVPEDAEILTRPIFEPYGLYKKLTGRKSGDAIQVGFVSDSAKSGWLETISRWLRGNCLIPDARVFWIRPSIKTLTRYLAGNPVDAIVSTGPPHSMHLIALELKQKTGIPWVADFRDPWSAFYYNDDLLFTRRTRQKQLSLEKKVLQSADRVITVSSVIGRELGELRERPVDVIHNGFDPADYEGLDFQPDSKKTTAKTKTITTADTNTESNPDPDSNSNLNSNTISDRESNSERTLSMDQNSETDPHPNTNPSSNTETDPNTNPNSNSETGWDTDTDSDTDSNPKPLPELEESSTFTISHTGAFQPAANPETVWEVLGRLLHSRQDFARDLRIRLVGRVDSAIRDSIADNGLAGHVHYAGYVPHSEVMRYQVTSALLLLCILRTKGAEGIITGKFFEYLASGTPVLCIGPVNGDTAGIIKECRAGETAGFDDDTAIERIIIEYYDNWKKGVKPEPDHNAVASYSRKEQTRTLAGILNSLHR